jgi:hypothetical protein
MNTIGPSQSRDRSTNSVERSQQLERNKAKKAPSSKQLDHQQVLHVRPKVKKAA